MVANVVDWKFWNERQIGEFENEFEMNKDNPLRLFGLKKTLNSQVSF